MNSSVTLVHEILRQLGEICVDLGIDGEPGSGWNAGLPNRKHFQGFLDLAFGDVARNEHDTRLTVVARPSLQNRRFVNDGLHDVMTGSPSTFNMPLTRNRSAPRKFASILSHSATAERRIGTS